MIFILALIGFGWQAEGVNYRKLYKEAVIHFKDPDFEAGRTKHLSSTALNLLKDTAHFKAFKKNAIFVEEHNKEDNRKWLATINKFSIMTDEEFSQHLGLNLTREIEEEINLSLQKQKRSTVDPALREKLEDKEVDYRPYLPPIKNQYACGSCWTFGAIVAMEYQVNKDRPVGGEMVALSEEQCLDCLRNNGCIGGWATDCYSWGYYHFSHWASSYNYIYEARENLKCRYDIYKNGMSGFKFTSPRAKYVSSEEDVLYAVANDRIGVLSCAMLAIRGFGAYAEGVYSSTECNGRGINHAVDIVGYGKWKGIPYWKVRNSWGTSWGDKGYLNMERGVNGNNLNMCHLTQYAHYPQIEGSDDGQGSGTESEAMRIECADGIQWKYRGVMNQTESGRTCQKWSSQEPQEHTKTPNNYPWSGLEKNYCRNPDGERRAWCYTTEPSERFELCSIPDCSLEKWCEVEDYEFQNKLDGSATYDDLNGAKTDCYRNRMCSGISQLVDGRYELTTGPLSPSTSVIYGLTLRKGLCEQLEVKQPLPGNYCKMENVILSGKMSTAQTLLDAMRLCRYHESCGGISGIREGVYILYSSKMSSRDDKMDSWFKDECPDLTKCGYDKQADYRGKINKTASGLTCQRWDSQTPHKHGNTPENKPDSGLEENFCRNPDGEFKFND